MGLSGISSSYCTATVQAHSQSDVEFVKFYFVYLFSLCLYINFAQHIPYLI